LLKGFSLRKKEKGVLNFLFELFFLNNSKRVPLNIDTFVTPSALAYWAIDDGGKLGSGFQLATHALSKDEVDLLDKFDEQNNSIKMLIKASHLNWILVSFSN
jgi:hypothetical protein